MASAVLSLWFTIFILLTLILWLCGLGFTVSAIISGIVATVAVVRLAVGSKEEREQNKKRAEENAKAAAEEIIRMNKEMTEGVWGNLFNYDFSKCTSCNELPNTCPNCGAEKTSPKLIPSIEYRNRNGESSKEVFAWKYVQCIKVSSKSVIAAGNVVGIGGEDVYELTAECSKCKRRYSMNVKKNYYPDKKYKDYEEYKNSLDRYK